MAIEGSAFLEFGSGDIITSLGVLDNVDGIAFVNSEPHPIGYIHEGELKTSDISVIMTFTKIESIDVLIKQLTELKEYMINKGESQ